MQKLDKLWLVALTVVFATVVFALGAVSIANANQVDEATYSIAVDQRGNMRLVGPGNAGNFNNQPKENERVIKLPSADLAARLVSDLRSSVLDIGDNVSAVRGALARLTNNVTTIAADTGRLGNTVASFEGDMVRLSNDVAAVQDTVARLGDNVTSIATDVGRLGSNVAALQGTAARLDDSTAVLNARVTQLEGTVAAQAADISALRQAIEQMGNTAPAQKYVLSLNGSGYLSNAIANFRSGDGQGAVEVWFKTSSTTLIQQLFASSDTATYAYSLQFQILPGSGRLQTRQWNNDGNADVVNGSANVADGKWHHAILSSSGSAWTILLDGVVETLTVNGGSNTGDWFADTSSRDNLTIGAITRATTGNYFSGAIGAVRIYSRPVAAPEATANFQNGVKGAASNTSGLVFDLPLTEGAGNPVDTVGSLTMTATGAAWTTIP